MSADFRDDWDDRDFDADDGLIDDEPPKVCFQCGGPAQGIKVWNKSGTWMADVCDRCFEEMMLASKH